MSKRKCKFRDEYSSEWKFIKQGRNCFTANCDVCNCSFSIQYGGKSDIKKHIETAKHKRFIASTSQDGGKIANLLLIKKNTDNSIKIKAPEIAMVSSCVDDIQDPSNEDHPIPLSPEQYLTEQFELPHTQDTLHSVPISSHKGSYKLQNHKYLTCVLDSLASDELFTDVTLTAQGKVIKAHKCVLSAVSSYFESILKANPCQHPIIIMPRDIRFEELSNIISYIYKGEMTVNSEDLPSLLRTAELLQVISLSELSSMGITSSGKLGQIGSQGINSAASAVSQKMQAHSTKSSNKRSAKFHFWPIRKEAPQNYLCDKDLFDKVDPLDIVMKTDTVNEEIESDSENIANVINESETSVDDDFHSSVVQNDNKSSDSHTSQKSCPLSKKRKTSVDASSFQADKGETENNPDPLLEDSLSYQTALFVCPYCFQLHRPTEVLQAHLRLNHPSEPSFLCKCGKVNVRQSLYDQHVKSCDSS